MTPAAAGIHKLLNINKYVFMARNLHCFRPRFRWPSLAIRCKDLAARFAQGKTRRVWK